MEKKYPLFGLDVSSETTPLEASLGWAVDLDADSGFIGRDALRAQRDAGLTRRLVGVEFADTSFMPAIGDAILLGDREVGRVTSGETGWYLGKNLAMGYVAIDTPDGSEVTVAPGDGGSSATGVVSDRAFYDPDRERIRA